MPLGMSGSIVSAVVQGKVYVGGGKADKESDEYKVMEYTPSSGEWTTLPPYRARRFVVTVIHNQLVLVGGFKSKMLGVWRADLKAWTHPYPDMHTACASCSAAVHAEWLVVAGGYDEKNLNLLSVEVLNTATKQWYAGPPMPTPTWGMKTAILGDMYYSMGGYGDDDKLTKTVLSVSLPALIRHTNSTPSSKGEPEEQIWKEIPGLPLLGSAPLSIRGSLLAVGGRNEDGEATTAIHLYQPVTREWVRVGDMPTPRYFCACTRISDREVLVAGGRTEMKGDRLESLLVICAIV